MNPRDSTDCRESNGANRYEYPKDSRLKFYQILQSQTNRNHKKTQCIEELSTKNGISNIKCNNSESPTIAKELLIQRRDSLKHSDRLHNVQKQNISTQISLNTNPQNDVYDIINYRNNQRRIEQLFMLIEGQSKQLQLLEMQINTLLSKVSVHQDNSYQASSQLLNNGIKPFESIKCYEKHHGTQTELNPTLNKVSIGVMTSFEFTIRSNLDVKVVSVENPQFPEEIRGVDKSHNETMNLIKSPLEKITERSEGRFSEQSDRHLVDPDQEVQCRSMEKVDRYRDESLRASTKVGWTFYNNILHHVNEILHDSAGIHSSSASYDAKQQVKLVGTAFSDATNIITPNINDTIFTMDPSVYPRVHFQTSIMQNSNSTMDPNASAHMKKLALKYLSNKFYETDNISEIQKSMNELGTTIKLDSVLENNLPMSMINNTNNEFFTANNSNFVESNILDIPILKSQPKLL